MGFRRLLGAAVDRMDALGDRMNEADLAKLTPEQREVHDAWTARTDAARAGTPASELPDPRLTGAVLQGEAGEVVAGIREAPRTRDAIEDPEAWAARRDEERAARDAAREPYLAPVRHPVHVTRIATRGKTQVREVADHLASTGLAGRPDLVYGAARVPDFISPGRLGREKSGVVEWDVVHAAQGPLPPAPVPAAVFLDAREQVVARAVDECAPLDEDVALDLLARAGLDPGATLGIARDVAIEKSGGDENDVGRIVAGVRGVHILVAAAGGAALERAAGAPRPWAVVADGPPDGVRVDVLQWEVIAQVVHPVRQHRPPMPSPFPHLPLTAVELLRSYLEIVGIAPADSYGAAVTHDRPLDLMGRTSGRTGVRRTGGGPKLPCADGELRKRMAGGHHVVVTYRDRPEYAEGRERFAAYSEAVLEARLDRRLGLRAPVPRPPNRLERTIERAGDVYEFFSMEPTVTGEEPRPRYCWPPVGR